MLVLWSWRTGGVALRQAWLEGTCPCSLHGPEGMRAPPLAGTASRCICVPLEAHTGPQQTGLLLFCLPSPLPHRRILPTRCCHTLRARAAASRALWGDLRLKLWEKPAGWTDSLARWLAAHKGGLASVQLSMFDADTDEAEQEQCLLAAMAGGALASLHLSHVADDVDLGQLSLLPGLTYLELSHCGLEALPQQLATPPLAVLHLKFCTQLGASGDIDAAFQPLAALGGSLRCLHLYNVGLARMPAALRVLGALRELELSLEGSVTCHRPRSRRLLATTAASPSSTSPL